MRRSLHVLTYSFLAVGLLATSVAAQSDDAFKVTEEFTSPNGVTNSDFAFWGDHAFSGYYSNSAPQGGVRIFDISDPSSPALIRDFSCDGQQADPIVWDRDANGVADLLLLAVDRTMASPECGAARSAHDDPLGWEGVRVFEMSDDPADPFTTITQVAAVYTDCGAHTITGWPKDDGSGLLVYVSSYPLRPGPTCGDTEHLNLANPYDADPGLPASPVHGVIQIVDVPFSNPAASAELPVQPQIVYPGDPDGINDWCERGLCLPFLEPAAVACHDIVVHVPERIAAGACAEQGQVWHIDANGIPDTLNPISIADDALSSAGTGQIPGAVDFFHSAMFNNEATVVNWVDESFGAGCPPMTDWQARPWHAAGTHATGRIAFTDTWSGAFLSEFQVGNLRPNAGPGEYCSAHMGMSVLGVQQDLLVNAWYTGGINVIDYSKPTHLKEVAYFDSAQNSGTWSAYPYTGPKFSTGPGMPIYASDGVTNNAAAEGMVVYRAILQNVGSHTVDHLNPQTIE